MITIAYISNRITNKFEWFIDSLARQLNGRQVPIQIVYVDFWKSQHPLFEITEPDFEIKHVEPIPSLVQGEHRITSKNYFSASNARNTGLVYAKYNYVMYVDDLSVLMPTWLDAVIEAAQGQYILEGAYRKDNQMVVEEGLLVSSVVSSEDSRWHRCGGGKQQGYDSWLYGCSVGVPLQTALEMNGWDLLGDTIGYEDSNFGIRAAKYGAQFIYDKRALTVESDELHFVEGNYFCREDPVATEEEYMSALNSFGVYRSVYNGQKRDMSHAMLDIVYARDHRAAHNYFSLRDLREIASHRPITIEDMKYPKIHWFTGLKLTDL